ncbi:dynein axonemal intermediate chain 4 isoform X2 [Amia ocellicauda]|uniref:dynein axonemal intermediate chain 4 isoform X2 n=1 Tax=Amia ocellicauda TaxID=2972642 RepID=UPI003463B5B8
MSTSPGKFKKPTIKVTTSSRLTINPRAPNVSGSAMNRLTHSTVYRSTTGSISRRSVSLQGDGRGLDKSSVRPAVQVFDDHGRDVTPRALFQPEPGAVQPRLSKMFVAYDLSASATSDLFSTKSVYQTGADASYTAPFSRSVAGSSTVSRSMRSTMESMGEEIEYQSARRDTSTSLSGVQLRREEVREQITEDMLDDVVDRYLTETETLWLLDMPAVTVSVNSEEAAAIKERNDRYAELCRNRAGNDQYVERTMQTFNGAPKTKEVQCEKVYMADAAVMATTWDMYDTFQDIAAEAEPMSEAGRSSRPESALSHRVDASRAADGAMSIISAACSTSRSSSGRSMEPDALPQTPTAPDPAVILLSKKFQQDLIVMERILMQNIFQPKLAAYRQLPILTGSEEVVKEETKGEGSSEKAVVPALERLWSFSCELTKGHNVSSMAWNKKNVDLLAVGYGQFDFKDQKSGLVCCWSLKNPMWPERIFHCESGVTAVDFSANNANFLAVGMHDGGIAIYNVQGEEKSPVIDSSDCANKHSSPVWQLRWVEDRGPSGEDKGETLVSVSADGRISKWYLRKGLDCMDLMKLKRTRPNEKAKRAAGEKDRKSEALISRQAPGLCFDFHPKDTNIYLAGTEEGHIHKCSCSYNEQYLETYQAHKGPLYRVTWSPFCPDVFLSCSADWTVQLWKQELATPVLGFSSTHRAVFDIAWSPKSATVFAAVNEGRVEIWDLGASILDPTVVSPASPGATLTSLLFACRTDCILIGDSSGQVVVYELKDLPGRDATQGSALYDIIASTLASQL